MQCGKTNSRVSKIVQRASVSRVLWVRRLGGTAMFNLTMSRLLSALIVLTYGVLFFVAEPLESTGDAVSRLLAIMGYFLLPLACIWFSEEMGEYMGTLPGPTINRATPEWMVRVGGWFLLFLPAIVGFFVFRNS